MHRQIGMMKFVIFSLVLIAIFVSKLTCVEAAACDIETQKNIEDTIFIPTNTANNACAGKEVVVSLTNEYRAYCVGSSTHCESRDNAWQTGEKHASFKQCVPAPETETDTYSVITHKNVAVTCTGSNSAVMDFHYVNATYCKCRSIFKPYKYNMN